jgi:SRSO17 transposase
VAKGERLHHWAYLELADLQVDDFSSSAWGLWTRGLLIRRRIADLYHDGGNPTSRKPCRRANPDRRESRPRALIRWSIQDVRCIAIRPANITACSLWRRAQQAVAQQAHVKRKLQP